MLQDPFWDQQRRDTYVEHVKPINDLVDRLRELGPGDVPYVAPFHGGMSAPVLSVLADPGKKSVATGFLCVRNPDPTSRVQRLLMDAVRLAPEDLTPWNAYPWTRGDGNLSEEEIDAGGDALLEMVDAMNGLQVLFLQGDRAWEVYRGVKRTLLQNRPGLEVVRTCHPLRPRTEPERDAQLEGWVRMAMAAGLWP